MAINKSLEKANDFLVGELRKAFAALDAAYQRLTERGAGYSVCAVCGHQSCPCQPRQWVEARR